MIKICSRKEIRELVNEFPNQLNCIVICEPDNEEAVADILPLCGNYIKAVFDDMEFPRKGKIHPQREHIEPLLNWANDKDDIFVACQAGISRSSAVAYLIGCMKLKPEWAIREILDANEHIPNVLIIKIGVDILGEGILPEIRAFYERVQGWGML